MDIYFETCKSNKVYFWGVCWKCVLWGMWRWWWHPCCTSWTLTKNVNIMFHNSIIFIIWCSINSVCSCSFYMLVNTIISMRIFLYTTVYPTLTSKQVKCEWQRERDAHVQQAAGRRRNERCAFILICSWSCRRSSCFTTFSAMESNDAGKTLQTLKHHH